MKSLLALLFISSLSTSLLALDKRGKPQNIYGMEIKPMTSNGELVQFPKGSDGWSCAPHIWVRSNGTLKDAENKVITTGKSLSGSYVEGNNWRVGHFPTDGTSEIKLEFVYSCSITESNISPSFNMDGEMEIAMSSTTHEQSVAWNCSTRNLLARKGHKTTMECVKNFDHSSYDNGGFTTGGDFITGGDVGVGTGGFYFAPFLSSDAGDSPVSWDDTTMEIELEFEKVKEDFIFNNCEKDSIYRRILFVNRGLVRADSFEQDFKLFININDQKVQISSDDGVFAQAISYCSDTRSQIENLKMTISGVELDTFSKDDKFFSQTASIDYSSQCHLLGLERKYYFTPWPVSNVLLHVSEVNPSFDHRMTLYESVARSNREEISCFQNEFKPLD